MEAADTRGGPHSPTEEVAIAVHRKLHVT
jgi:hypothetical protein